MDRNDLITLGKLAINKFGGKPEYKEQVDGMKEDVRRLQLLSPVVRRKSLSKVDEKKVLKSYKDLGITVRR